MINLKHFTNETSDKIISAEFEGRDHDCNSHYLFLKDKLECVVTTDNFYSASVANKNNEIEETQSKTYLFQQDVCMKVLPDNYFERAPLEICNDLSKDAQTYQSYIFNASSNGDALN